MRYIPLLSLKFLSAHTEGMSHRNKRSKILLRNQKRKKKKKNRKFATIAHQQLAKKQNATRKEIQTSYNQVKMSDLYMNFNFIRRQESPETILNSLNSDHQMFSKFNRKSQHDNRELKGCKTRPETASKKKPRGLNWLCGRIHSVFHH